MRPLGVVAALSLGLAAGTVRAQGSLAREAERRSDRAKKLYREGHYPEALLLFQAAYDLDPAPPHLYNIGLSREKVLDHEGCAQAFRGYLTQTEGTTEADVVQHRKQAEEAIGRCRARAVIPVRVTSSPPAAALVVDDGHSSTQRGRTPRDLQLAPGHYKISAELDGYVTATQEVDVDVGTRPEIDFALDKLSTLRVQVDPAGAEIRVDEGAWESPPAERQVPAGDHRVEVKKRGYEPVTRTVPIVSGQDLSLLLRLSPLPVRRRIALEAPAGARLRVDGTDLPPGHTSREVAPGVHRVEAAAAGTIPFAGDLRVPDDQDLRVRVRLAPERTRRQKIVVWSLLGAAGAAAAIGGYYGILVARDHADFEDQPSVALRDEGERNSDRADVFLAGAALIGVGALVYHFVITRPGESSGEIVR